MHPLTKIIASLVLACLTLAACCPVAPRSHGTPPPPISIDEQVNRLAGWSRQLPRIRATSVDRGVALKFRDNEGRAKEYNVEGTLLIHQHFADEANSTGKQTPGDVLLVATSFSKQVFQAGKNAGDWWFTVLVDTNTAWRGDARKPVDFSQIAASQRVGVLRADLVLDLLALTDLPAVHTPPESQNGQTVVMRVNDLDVTNELWVEQLGPLSAGGDAAAGFTRLTREIIVDRITGDVAEVRLYDPSGVLVVQSVLSGYAPVSMPPDATSAGPRFPRRISVSYPAQQISISLQFEKVTIPNTMRDIQTPDFEGLHVIPVE